MTLSLPQKGQPQTSWLPVVLPLIGPSRAILLRLVTKGGLKTPAYSQFTQQVPSFDDKVSFAGGHPKMGTLHKGIGSEMAFALARASPNPLDCREGELLAVGSFGTFASKVWPKQKTHALSARSANRCGLSIGGLGIFSCHSNID